MQHEPDGIVHRLGFRKRLVPALVGLDPDPRADGPLEPPVAHPGEAAEGGGRGVGCGDPGNPEGGERGGPTPRAYTPGLRLGPTVFNLLILVWE